MLHVFMDWAWTIMELFICRIIAALGMRLLDGGDDIV